MKLDPITSEIVQSETLQNFRTRLVNGQHIFVKGLTGSVKSLVLSWLYQTDFRRILYIGHDENEIDIIKEDLNELVGSSHIAYFSVQKEQPYDAIYVDHVRKGLYQDAVEKIIHQNEYISLISSKTIFKKLAPKEYFEKQKVVVKVSEVYDFDVFKYCLNELGFSRESMVENPGDMSIRGGIVDVFPFSNEHPIRLEFWGDTVESIREFNVASQRSLREINQLILFPQYPHEFRTDDILNFVPLLKYFPKDTLVFIDEPELVMNEMDAAFHDASDIYHNKAKYHDFPPPEKLFQTWEELNYDLVNFKRVNLGGLSESEHDVIDIGTLPQQTFRGNFKIFKQYFDRLLTSNEKIQPRAFFLCDGPDQISRLDEIMSDANIPVSKIQFIVNPLSTGFLMPELNLHVFTENEFFGRIKKWHKHKHFKSGLTYRQLQSLVTGDFVVHVDHGIGVYRGLEKIQVGGNERECLMLEYREGDLVYVPLEKMNRVQKYSAKEGVVPQISKLGSQDWERLKNRTKKRIKDIAGELIELYAKRKKEQGYPFSKDTLWQRELEASFPYEDTPDQARATDEIKQDMESASPMERLVCGDVGYGKTEVALRAAFKAINNNKQVAILVPTTVLAIQHYNTFRERLTQFPVKVEMLSRFRSTVEQRKIIEWLKEGKVDIIIGTHRLLSKDVVFYDLGLVVIDEEQRFGVSQKEKLKKFKTNVDILTMTATPIPRTLNLSLLGVRDMSLITTPPQGRQPIHTEVIPFNNEIIRSAILKEVERGGQIYFVHNRVQSIYSIANLLKRLVPEVTFVVAHGQMEGNKLEKIMGDFALRKYDCLIATMIIENGLDIPNVNTLIINRADRFGVSQLYQLRGRVGRSSQHAYAYLIAPPLRHLSPEAIKRLRTIEEFTELGSGLQIAMRDLQIRGAGNILGAEQSGSIGSLGFDLYCKIIDEAVAELKESASNMGGMNKEIPDTKVEIKFDAYLPEKFVEQAEERVNIYKRITDIRTLDKLSELAEELRDRFGPLPETAQNLISLVQFKLMGNNLSLKNISINNKYLNVSFHPEVVDENRELLQQRLVTIVDNAKYPFTFVQGKNGDFGIRITIPGNEKEPLSFSKNFLQSIM
ncbi:transcription-repair coupling factor [candidate division KSB1 bacterium]|nr:transcription-repair coupling factor [candidate division KSB1 bacterium]